MRYKGWEIWLAQVVYEDKPLVQKRPVLVVPTGQVLLVAKMTKTEPRNKYEHKIVYWKESGLLMATTIRTEKLLKMPEKDMLHKLGDLHPVDIAEFEKKLILLRSKNQ